MNIRINSDGMMEIQRMPSRPYFPAICPYHVPMDGGLTVCGDWCVQFDDSHLPRKSTGGTLLLCHGKKYTRTSAMAIEDLRSPHPGIKEWKEIE